MTEGRYCSQLRKDGLPCRALPSRTTGLCPAHTAGHREICVEAGKSKSTLRRLGKRLSPTLTPLMDALAEAFENVENGTLKSSQAMAMSSLASTWLKAYELSLLELRMATIEKQLSEALGGQHG